MSIFNQNNLFVFQQEQFPGGPLVVNGLQFQLELTDEERYDFENIITKYPVARGADRADNLFRTPNLIRIIGLCRDAFFQGKPVTGGFVQSIADSLRGNSPFNATLSQALTSLQLCFNAPVTYRVSTSVSKAISSMAIKKGTLIRTNKESNAFRVVLNLEEIILRDSTISQPNAATQRKYQGATG
jgi:hypothetical protein